MSLLPASFRDAKFFVSGNSTETGRKVVLHEFVNSDKRGAEDLGLAPAKVTLEIVVSNQEMRNTLINALNKQGPGLLVHPTFGSMTVVALPYTISENRNEAGIARMSVTFAKVAVSAQPFIAGPSLQRIAKPSLATIEAAKAGIAAKVSVVGASATAVTQTRDKVLSIATKMQDAARNVSSKTIAPFQRAADKLKRNVGPYVNDAKQLADAVDDLMTTFQALSDDPLAALGLNKSLFDFGLDDILKGSRFSKDKAAFTNAAALNQYTQASSLAYAFINAGDVEWANDEQLAKSVESLNTTYDRLANELPDDVRENLDDARAAFQQHIQRIRPQLFRIVTVQAAAQPLDVLSYAYYGSTDSTDALKDLNRATDIALISGKVKVFAL